MVAPKDTSAFGYLTSPVKDVANPLGIIFVFDSGKTGLNVSINRSTYLKGYSCAVILPL